MAVRKNPDWTVWLADVWHWASRPPGIYICIIILMAGTLLYALSTPQPVVYRQPAPVAPVASPYRQPAPTTPAPSPRTNCTRPYLWSIEDNACVHENPYAYGEKTSPERCLRYGGTPTNNGGCVPPLISTSNCPTYGSDYYKQTGDCGN